MSQQQTTPPTIFDACEPRQDVVAGEIPEDQFAASIDGVAHNTDEPDVYADPELFFEKTYPTDGIQELLTGITTRFVHDHKGEYSGTNGIIRLDTSFGGGKTHTEIAAYHLANSPTQINDLATYLESDDELGIDNETLANEYLEQTALGLDVNTAVVVGAEIDANNARCDMADDDAPATKTIWGEIAYQLFGQDGYEFLKEYDDRRIAPGAKQLTELFEIDDDPSLIMLDEIAAYMAQASGLVENIDHEGSLNVAENAVVGESTLAQQTNAFLMALLAATENTDHVTVVLSIADTAFEDQADEVRRMLADVTDEFNNIADRTEQSVTPTEDKEIASVLRYRLFEDVDEDKRNQVVSDYVDHYDSNRSEFPDLDGDNDEDSLEKRLENYYPFHPTVIKTLTKELDSLPQFHRTRGALKLLSRAISDLWYTDTDWGDDYDRHFLRLFDIRPANTHVRSTLLRLYDSTGLDFEAPVKADIYSADGTAHATTADEMYGGAAPMGTQITTAILWKSLVETASGRGANKPTILYAVSHIDFEVAQHRNTLDKLVDATNDAACYYLHREGNGTARYVFKVQPKPIKIVESVDVDEGIVRTTMIESLEDIVGKTGAFNVIMQPESPSAVPDDPTSHYLCVMDFDTVSIINNTDTPDLVEDIHSHWAASEGGQKQMRVYKNNVAFLVPEEYKVSDARETAEKLASIKHIQTHYGEEYDLSGEAQDKLSNMRDAVKSDLSEELKNAYSNVYYAEKGGVTHSAFTATDHLRDEVSDHLAAQDKLVKSGDGAYGIQWVESRIWKNSAEVMTTKELEEQFGKRPQSDLLLSPIPLRETIAQIVSESGYAYWDAEAEQGYYTSGSEIETSGKSISDAENLTSGLDTGSVVIGEAHHVFTSVTKLVESDETTISWETWECDDCGEVFSDEAGYNTHDCTTHTCDDCGKAFSNESDLDAHECSDTTFECDECGEVFSVKTNYEEHTCTVETTVTVENDSPSHIGTALKELRSEITAEAASFKQTHNLIDADFTILPERIFIGVESVDGWQETWFIANNFVGDDMLEDSTTVEFEYIAETGNDSTGEFITEYTGDLAPFADHCKFNMEPSELTGNSGERISESQFKINNPSLEDGSTPTYDTLLDRIEDLIAVDNGFTINLYADIRFTTDTGGDS